MKKQFLIGILALSMIFIGVTAFTRANADGLSIKKNDAEIEDIEENNKITLKGLKTYQKGNTEMVPLRELAEKQLDLKIVWRHEDRSIEIGQGPQWTSIKIGENSYYYARMAPFKLSEAPEITNGLTYVPVEFFTEVLGYEVLIN